LLVGCVARIVPVKDHPTFLRAAALVAARRSGVVFASVGDGPPEYRRGLEQLAAELGLGGRMRWLGVRSDMPAVHSALDVVVLCSAWGEGMPVAIGEAMACGVVPVVSDQSDMPRVVGDLG